MTQAFNSRIQNAKIAIQNADHILIGAGAGLSTAAGYLYSGERFTSNFQDFISKYHMTDMYTATFYPFETQEEKWALFSKIIKMNRFESEKEDTHKDLLKLVENKDHFVLTTNVDGCFYKAGFNKSKVFMIQGDYGKFQCEKPCHNKLYDNEKVINDMVASQKDCKIPTSMIPKCPICGRNFEANLRKDEFFVEDDYWNQCNLKYNQFLKKLKGTRFVLIEIGVGFNTPGIIRYPFEQLTYNEPNATLIRINKDYPECAEENREKSILFTEDTNLILKELNSSF